MKATFFWPISAWDGLQLLQVWGRIPMCVKPKLRSPPPPNKRRAPDHNLLQYLRGPSLV